MELKPSTDFGARDFDGRGGREIHDHFFIGANTGLAAILGRPRPPSGTPGSWPTRSSASTSSASARAAWSTASSWGRCVPRSPTLEPGGKYLVEVVVRTLNIGHLVQPGDGRFQRDLGRADCRGRAAGSSAVPAGSARTATVDPYSHFINVYMLDRNGNRIDRRNPQDIFVPLYNKQIPPGAGQVVHFGLEVPEGARGRSRSRRRSTIASSTGPTWTTSSARGRAQAAGRR